jgi:hypothetical protein
MIAQKSYWCILDTANNLIGQVSIQLKDRIIKTLCILPENSATFWAWKQHWHLFITNPISLASKPTQNKIDLSNAFTGLGTIILEESKIDLMSSSVTSGMTQIGDTTLPNRKNF